MTPQEFLPKAVDEAVKSGHIWSAMAACEAALESAWGNSQLCQKYNNLFGQKAPHNPANYAGYEVVELPTKEFIDHQWVTVNALWLKFPDWSSSFKFRMQQLIRLSEVYPEYALALRASTPEYFVGEVSQKWSTDPERAKKVMEIYHAHQDLLKLPSASIPDPATPEAHTSLAQSEPVVTEPVASPQTV